MTVAARVGQGKKRSLRERHTLERNARRPNEHRRTRMLQNHISGRSQLLRRWVSSFTSVFRARAKIIGVRERNESRDDAHTADSIRTPSADAQAIFSNIYSGANREIRMRDGRFCHGGRRRLLQKKKKIEISALALNSNHFVSGNVFLTLWRKKTQFFTTAIRYIKIEVIL